MVNLDLTGNFNKHISFGLAVIAGTILLLLGHLYDLHRSWKNGSCEREYTTIIYRYYTDYKIACIGISRAERFFQDFGFSTDTPIMIFFENRLPIDQELYDQGQVWGYFNSRSNYIVLPSYFSSLLRKTEKEFFLVKVNRKFHLMELLTSTASHEVAHLLALYNYEMETNSLLETRQKEKMSNAAQEYIASVVQFYSMEKHYRNQILERFDPKLIFDNEQEINNLIFSFSPQEFYIKSHRHFQSEDWSTQKHILKRIFTNKFSPEISYGLYY